jgi:hypothetical protein
MGAAAAWTMVVLLWNGHQFQLEPKPVENPLGCIKAGEVQVSEWAAAHPMAQFSVVRWGCTRQPEYPA